jgi:hypothetical protein
VLLLCIVVSIAIEIIVRLATKENGKNERKSETHFSKSSQLSTVHAPPKNFFSPFSTTYTCGSAPYPRHHMASSVRLTHCMPKSSRNCAITSSSGCWYRMCESRTSRICPLASMFSRAFHVDSGRLSQPDMAMASRAGREKPRFPLGAVASLWLL